MPAERDVDPVRPVVELVAELVERLLEQEDVEQQLELRRASRGRKRRRAAVVEVGAQERRDDPACARSAAQRLEPRRVLGRSDAAAVALRSSAVCAA